MTQIVVRMTSVDGYTARRTFKTVAGARKFAHAAVGAHPEMGGSYAISGDGIAKITAQGVTLAELFPSQAATDGFILGRRMSDAEYEV